MERPKGISNRPNEKLGQAHTDAESFDDADLSPEDLEAIAAEEKRRAAIFTVTQVHYTALRIQENRRGRFERAAWHELNENDLEVAAETMLAELEESIKPPEILGVGDEADIPTFNESAIRAILLDHGKRHGLI